MKLLKPSQISGEIMTLIQEADKSLVIVSPYYNISNWKKLLNSLTFPINKKIEIEFYVRQGESKSINEIKSLDLIPTEIKRLHSKLYFNENYGIVSSMNLTESSDKESLDIAYKTETKDEYAELINYYNRYIKINLSKVKVNKVNPVICNLPIANGNWATYIVSQLQNKIGDKFHSKFEGNSFILNGPNVYYAHISRNGNQNCLNISGVISQAQRSILLSFPSSIFKEESDKEFYLENGHYSYQSNSFSYHSNANLKSHFITSLFKDDYDTVIKIILDFICGLQNFKTDLYLKTRSK